MARAYGVGQGTNFRYRGEGKPPTGNRTSGLKSRATVDFKRDLSPATSSSNSLFDALARRCARAPWGAYGARPQAAKRLRMPSTAAKRQDECARIGRSAYEDCWKGLHRRNRYEVEVLGQLDRPVKHHESRLMMLRPSRASTAASPSLSSASNTASCALMPPPAAASWQASVTASGNGG